VVRLVEKMTKSNQLSISGKQNNRKDFMKKLFVSCLLLLLLVFYFFLRPRSDYSRIIGCWSNPSFGIIHLKKSGIFIRKNAEKSTKGRHQITGSYHITSGFLILMEKSGIGRRFHIKKPNPYKLVLISGTTNILFQKIATQ